MRLLLATVGAFLAPTILLLTGCDDVLDPSRAEVDSIVLEPVAPSLERGEQLQLQVATRAADGTPLTGRQIFWASEDSSVAKVSATGVLSGVGVGTTRVAASSEGRSALVNVVVRTPAVARVSVSPQTVTLASRATGTLAAAIFDARDNALHDRSVRWESRSHEVVRVGDDGSLQAVRRGSAFVVATVEGKSDSARVTVQQGPPTQIKLEGNEQTGMVSAPLLAPLVVQLLDEFEEAVAGVEVRWTVSAGGGTVTPAVAPTDVNGRASAIWTLGSQPGMHTATATVGSLSGSVRARATPGLPRNVEVSRDSTEMVALGDTVRLAAAATDAHGNALDGVSYTWQSLSPAVATVAQTGRVEAVGNGRALIVASAGTAADTAVVRVTQRIARVVLASKQATINALGFTRPLTAEARDRNGHRIAGAAVAWNSLDGNVASVDNAGVVTARLPGTARIRAVVGGFADTATVTVQQVVASVATTPASDTLDVGQTRQLGAGAADSAGAPVPDASFQWSSSAATVARVDSQGRVQALLPGTATISATSQGRTATTTIAVRAVAVDRIAITPDRLNLSAGQSQSLTAVAYDAGNNPLTGRTFTWSSTNPGVATVSQSGVVTAVRPGRADVRAQTEGRAATVRVSVNNSSNP